MKLRHATALVLTGWYLMIPPQLGGDRRSYDPHASLARWFAYRSFDSAHECEGGKFLEREGHKQDGDPLKSAFESAQCIATDDPRLKESK